MLLENWIKESPFTLTMSSGFFGFYAHCGMLSILEERQLLPTKLTGSSAGGLIAALWAAGMKTQQIADLITNLNRKDFWDPGVGMGLLKGKKFIDLLRQHLPVTTFDRCRARLSLSVHNIDTNQTEVVDSGELAPAIAASCAYPFLFQPVKMNGNRYLDGGISDRPGILGSAQSEKVLYHHLMQRSKRSLLTGRSVPLFPERQNLVTIAMKNLPKVGPFKMERGKSAYLMARELTEKLLQESVEPSLQKEHPITK